MNLNRLARRSTSRSRVLPRSTSHLKVLHACPSSLRAYSDAPSSVPPNTEGEGVTASSTHDDTPVRQRRSKRRSITNQLPPLPDISKPIPFLDSCDEMRIPPSKLSPFASRIIVRNDPPLLASAGADGSAKEGEEREMEEEDDDEAFGMVDGEDEHAPILPLGRLELEKLHRFPLIRRRVTQQTGKGKIHRRAMLVVVGNGNGLVGYGQAKHDDPTRASSRAFAMAVRSMDYVDRFENRTIWTEMSSKLGATRIILRPRPVGFGLHCNPNIHQVLKAAGIKDISAKVWGSRNPLNVIKLLFRMLHAGNAPLAMGNGIGGPGRKLDKGSGVRGKQEIERERGRKLLILRTR